MKRIILTGGGTAGHVTPNIALIPELKKRGFEIHYIGSKTGIEKELIGNFDIPYYGISSGKLRRYFDVKNFTDPFRILKGYSEAKKLIKKIKPDVIFSKGGFVTVPVVKAASRQKVPCVLHESDISPGLANRLCIPSATAICANFPETIANLPEDKAYLTGTPIRSELFSGNRLKGLDFCGFTANKPVILVIGGSLGSVRVNEAVREIFENGKVFFATLGYASDVTVQADKTGIDEDAVSAVIHKATIYMPFAELVDIEKEIERLEKEAERLTKELARSNGMLNNERFISKAPQAKIDEEKAKLTKYTEMMAQVKERLAQLTK